MRLIILFVSFFFYASFTSAQVTANAGPDRQSCVNDTVKVTGSGLNAGDTGSYLWTDLDMGVISRQQVLIIKLPSAGQHTLELKVTRVHNGITYIERDSFLMQVYGLPQIILPAPDTLCSGGALSQLKTKNYAYNDPNGIWSGPFVTGANFDPGLSPKTKQYEGPYKIYYKYTHPLTHCSNSDFTYKFIQSQPQVNILNKKPYQQCENKLFRLKASVKFAKAQTWTTTGDGIIYTPRKDTTAYINGIQDTANGTVTMTLTTDTEGVCASASDNIQLLLEPYPIFTMPPHFVFCEEASINFKSNIIKPLGSNNLRYSWNFGNGDSLDHSTQGSPSNIRYKTAKQDWYDVKLKVHNQWGSAPGEECTTIKDSQNYVRVLPQPHAAFSSDPTFFTTVDNPVFNFTDETKIAWGKMFYQWSFDAQHNLSDTSHETNPSHTYAADTGSYWVHLKTTYAYYDFVVGDVFCWDTISQLRKIGPAGSSELKVYTLAQNKSIDIGIPFSGELRVMNGLGQTIELRKVKKGKREHFDIDDWTDATYFFVLENGKDRIVKKFLKF